MLEAYAAGWDYNDMMDFTEGLFESIALNLFGDTKIRFDSRGRSDRYSDRPQSALETDVDERGDFRLRPYRRR